MRESGPSRQRITQPLSDTGKRTLSGPGQLIEAFYLS